MKAATKFVDSIISHTLRELSWEQSPINSVKIYMSQSLDLGFIAETYQKMSDSELIHVATQNASGMTEEAQKIIKEEIERRKLNPGLFSGVKAQNKELTNEEIEQYCSIVQSLSCPDCGCTDKKLNGTVSRRTMSFILFTNRQIERKVACPACLDKANRKAQIITLLLGWWGIPWGIFRTIQSLTHNLKIKKTHHLEQPNDSLLLFVNSNIGLIEAHKNNRQLLQKVIC